MYFNLRYHIGCLSMFFTTRTRLSHHFNLLSARGLCDICEENAITQLCYN